MTTENQGIRIVTCGCGLEAIDFSAHDIAVVNEVLTSLSTQYREPVPQLTPEQLEEIRQQEIAEWLQEGEFGGQAAEVLQTIPVLVAANYQCDRFRALGECTLMKKGE